MNIILSRSVNFLLIFVFSVYIIHAKEPGLLSSITSQWLEFDSIDSSPDRTSYLSTQRVLSKEERKDLEKKVKEIANGLDRKRMSLEQLESVMPMLQLLGDHFVTLLHIDQYLLLCKDASKIQKYKRVKADILFEQGKLEEAEGIYREYCLLYPGAVDKEEVAYRLIVTLRLQMRETDQDQSKTREVIHFASLFLEKEKIYKTYALEVAKIRLYAYKHLYDHEAGVFNFYLKNKKFPAAQGRLAHMRQEFMASIPHIEADLLHQEYRLASAQNDKDRMNRVVAQLEKKYPIYMTAVFEPEQGKNKNAAAQDKKKQRVSYANRF